MGYKYIRIIIILLILFLSAGCGESFFSENLEKARYKDPSAPVEERVEDLLTRMTLIEKLGQMVIPDRQAIREDSDITDYFLGALLSGGGSGPAENEPEEWAKMVNRYQAMALKTRLGIPLIYGIDAVHGHNNVKGAVIFPHNIGMGAAHDEKMVETEGRITALEVAGTGITWTFAPCIAVPQNERWGRTYEGYSEYAPLTAELGAAFIRGFQGVKLSGGNYGMVATAKHFAGDGGTYNGVDRGNTIIPEEDFERIHLSPYVAAVKAGTKTVMVSFSSVNGQKMHGNRHLITDVLKKQYGFRGFVVSDWGGIEEIDVRYPDCVKRAVNAGIDMVMEPFRYQRFLLTVKALKFSDDISEERIDDAVRRILRVKFETGLFEYPYADESLTGQIGSAEHRKAAREAVRKSLVLLKNKNRILPLSRKIKSIFVAGKNADDLGNQCGGWTISWQGLSGDITEGTTVLEAIRKAVSPGTKVTYNEDGEGAMGHDVAVVVIGELPYAEMRGDKEDLSISQSDIETIKNCNRAQVPVVVILISGRPMLVAEHLKSWNALVAAWLPGTEGEGITDVLFGDYPFTGRLSFSWPRSTEQLPINFGDKNYDPLFPYGYGLRN
ncbi:MAG: glycoside hydrolase family 3 C-terminal domain-containing protein [Spirochaetales bacterium]|nr:glycoside hydrolase family 3 C-terminal domain-containing protein [Spirochaetales bacterium]